jgi:hypothetical protein
MATELSQDQLEEMVVGKPSDPNVVFYDQAILNVTRSKAAGKRMYDNCCFMKETQHGVDDWTPIVARKEHYKKHPEEYKYYLSNRQGIRSPSVNIIPNISPAEIQELIDFGLSTIKLLASATIVPSHLEHIQQSAKTIQSVLTETKDGNQEKSNKESSIKTEVLLAPDRQDNCRNVGQPAVPASVRSAEDSPAKRTQTDRRIDNNSGKLSSDWSISF